MYPYAHKMKIRFIRKLEKDRTNQYKKRDQTFYLAT